MSVLPSHAVRHAVMLAVAIVLTAGVVAPASATYGSPTEVHGHVTDLATGRPIQGGTVYGAASARTDEEGFYALTISGLPMDRCVDSTFYARTADGRMDPVERTVCLRAGDNVTLDLVVDVWPSVVPTDPTPADPAPTDPAPTEPAPTEPAPEDPAPTKLCAQHHFDSRLTAYRGGEAARIDILSEALSPDTQLPDGDVALKFLGWRGPIPPGSELSATGAEFQVRLAGRSTRPQDYFLDYRIANIHDGLCDVYFGEIRVRALPRPITRPDHYELHVGSTISVRPLANDIAAHPRLVMLAWPHVHGVRVRYRPRQQTLTVHVRRTRSLLPRHLILDYLIEDEAGTRVAGRIVVRVIQPRDTRIR